MIYCHKPKKMSLASFYHDIETSSSTLVNLVNAKRVCVDKVHVDRDALTFEATIKGGYVLRILFFDVSRYPSRADGAVFFEPASTSQCVDSTKVDTVSQAVCCFIERGPFSQVLANAFHAISKTRILPCWDSFSQAAKIFARFDAGMVSQLTTRDSGDHLSREIRNCQVLEEGGGLERNGARFEGSEGVAKDLHELERFGYRARIRSLSSRFVELAAAFNVSNLELVDEAKERWGLNCGRRIEICTIWKDEHVKPTSWSNQPSVRFEVRLLRDGSNKNGNPVTVPFHLGNSIQSVLNSSFYQVLKWIFAKDNECGWAGALANVRELERTKRGPKLCGQEADKLERTLCSKVLRIYESEREEEKAAWHNLALLAVRWVRREILTANQKCTQCRLLMPDGVHGSLKLRACSRNICTFQSSELRLHDGLLELELKFNPVVVDLLISLTCYAASDESDRKVLDPAPGPAIIDKVASRDLLKLEYNKTRRLLRSGVPALTRESTRSVVEALQTIPPVLHLYNAVRDGWKIRSYLEHQNAHPLAYQLLYWIVASNQAELRLLTDSLSRVRGPVDLYAGSKKLHQSWQFIVQSGTPEKEAIFAEFQKQYSSGYAFHGAGVESWHSILRNGLDCKEKLHGRGAGDGVYLSKRMGYSADFSKGVFNTTRQQYTLWSNSMLRPTSCLAVVEYIRVPQVKGKKKASDHLVIEDSTHVMARYLLVGSEASLDDARKLLSLTNEADNDGGATTAGFRANLLINEAHHALAPSFPNQNILLEPLLACHAILQMISEHDLVLWASAECDRLQREGKSPDAVRSALRHLSTALKKRVNETGYERVSFPLKHHRSMKFDCIGCEASSPTLALKLFMDSSNPSDLDASVHIPNYSVALFPSVITELVRRLGPSGDPIEGWSADKSLYQTEEECIIPKPSSVDVITASAATCCKRSKTKEGRAVELIDFCGGENAMTEHVTAPPRLRLKRRTRSSKRTYVPRKQRRIDSSYTYNENRRANTSRSCKLMDLPAHLMMKLLDTLLEREGLGFLAAERARSILSLAATCRRLRRLCSEALPALYLSFYRVRDEEQPYTPRSQSVLDPILKLAGGNLRQLDINCREDGRHIRWHTNLGILCPNIKELSISSNYSTVFFSTYKGLLELIGINLKVFKGVSMSFQWELQNLKELIRLCPHLEKLVLHDAMSTLGPSGFYRLCDVYGPQMVELGLTFGNISVSKVIETIEKKFPKLEFLHISGPFTPDARKKLNRMAFDMFKGYYKARAALESKSGTCKSQTTHHEESYRFARRLRVLSAELNATEVKDIKKICTESGSHLVSVDLFDLVGVDDSLLEILGNTAGKLRSASLFRHPLVTDKGVEAFCRGAGASLRHLIIGGYSYARSERKMKVTSRSLMSVVKYCTGLNMLDVSGFAHLSDSDLAMIARGLCEKLKVLWITPNPRMTGASARALARHCPSVHIVITSTSTRHELLRDREAIGNLRMSSFQNFRYSPGADGSEQCQIEDALRKKFCGITPARNFLCEAAPPPQLDCLPKGRRQRATRRRTKKR